MKHYLTAIAYQTYHDLTFIEKLKTLSLKKCAILSLVHAILFYISFLTYTAPILAAGKVFSLIGLFVFMLFIFTSVITLNVGPSLNKFKETYPELSIEFNLLEKIRLFESTLSSDKYSFMFDFDVLFKTYLENSENFNKRGTQLYFKKIIDKKEKNDLEKYHLYLYKVFQQKIYDLNILKELHNNDFVLGTASIFLIMENKSVKLDEFKKVFPEGIFDESITESNDSEFYSNIAKVFYSGPKTISV